MRRAQAEVTPVASMGSRSKTDLSLMSDGRLMYTGCGSNKNVKQGGKLKKKRAQTWGVREVWLVRMKSFPTFTSRQTVLSASSMHSPERMTLTAQHILVITRPVNVSPVGVSTVVSSAGSMLMASSINFRINLSLSARIHTMRYKRKRRQEHRKKQTKQKVFTRGCLVADCGEKGAELVV